MLEMSNKINYGYDSVDEAFPAIDPGCEPTGYRVLFQLRSPKKKTRGGIILTDDVREADQWNTQVAKVVAMGTSAFCDRNTGAEWHEGAWVKPGDFVRVPKFGGDRFTVVNGEDEAIFVIFRDADISAIVRDPLTVVSYI
jgi:co-chaperonin GroES (HSP10)